MKSQDAATHQARRVTRRDETSIGATRLRKRSDESEKPEADWCRVGVGVTGVAGLGYNFSLVRTVTAQCVRDDPNGG